MEKVQSLTSRAVNESSQYFNVFAIRPFSFPLGDHMTSLNKQRTNSNTQRIYKLSRFPDNEEEKVCSLIREVYELPNQK